MTRKVRHSLLFPIVICGLLFITDAAIAQVRALLEEIRIAMLTSKDASTKLNLQDLADRLTNEIDNKK